MSAALHLNARHDARHQQPAECDEDDGPGCLTSESGERRFAGEMPAVDAEGSVDQSAEWLEGEQRLEPIGKEREGNQVSGEYDHDRPDDRVHAAVGERGDGEDVEDRRYR